MYEVGDKVIYQGADKNAYKKVGVLKSIEEKDGKPQLTVEFEGGETFTAPVDDWSKEFTNAARNAKFKVGDKVKVVGKGLASKGWVGKVAEVRSGGWPYVVKFDGRENGEYAEEEIAIANAVTNGSYDTLIIKKVPQYGNKWCIFQDGVSNRLIPRVFDSPEWAKKYIKEDLPAWADAKIRVKNDCVSTNSVVRNAMAANRRVARNGESEQREIVEMNIDSLKKDLDKVVRGLDETKRWMGKYGDNRIASIDKAKGAIVQAIQQLKY